MTDLRRMLVASDFSAMASRAIDRAALIARGKGARLDLIHIATPVLLDKIRWVAEEHRAEAQQALLDASRNQLDIQAVSILERYGISCEKYVASGSLIRELINHADSLAADLIILGFCGVSLMRHFLLGSTAERLVTKAPCPMLVVKKTAEDQYRSLLVPVDFSPISIPTLLSARSIAPEAEISLLHVYEAPFEGKLHYAGVSKKTIRHYRIATRQAAMQQMWNMCKEAEIPQEKVRLLAIHGNPSHHIIAQESLRSCDLIVIGKHGENMLENLFLGSVTRHVIARSRCDVLVSV